MPHIAQALAVTAQPNTVVVIFTTEDANADNLHEVAPDLMRELYRQRSLDPLLNIPTEFVRKLLAAQRKTPLISWGFAEEALLPSPFRMISIATRERKIVPHRSLARADDPTSLASQVVHEVKHGEYPTTGAAEVCADFAVLQDEKARRPLWPSRRLAERAIDLLISCHLVSGHPMKSHFLAAFGDLRSVDHGALPQLPSDQGVRDGLQLMRQQLAAHGWRETTSDPTVSLYERFSPEGCPYPYGRSGEYNLKNPTLLRLVTALQALYSQGAFNGDEPGAKEARRLICNLEAVHLVHVNGTKQLAVIGEEFPGAVVIPRAPSSGTPRVDPFVSDPVVPPPPPFTPESWEAVQVSKRTIEMVLFSGACSLVLSQESWFDLVGGAATDTPPGTAWVLYERTQIETGVGSARVGGAQGLVLGIFKANNGEVFAFQTSQAASIQAGQAVSEDDLHFRIDALEPPHKLVGWAYTALTGRDLPEAIYPPCPSAAAPVRTLAAQAL